MEATLADRDYDEPTSPANTDHLADGSIELRHVLEHFERSDERKAITLESDARGRHFLDCVDRFCRCVSAEIVQPLWLDIYANDFIEQIRNFLGNEPVSAPDVEVSSRPLLRLNRANVVQGKLGKL